jgi:hypothetical protein
MKVHYRVHRSLPLVPILSQIKPVHTTKYQLSNIPFNIIRHRCLGLPSGLFLSGFPISNLHAFLLHDVEEG